MSLLVYPKIIRSYTKFEYFGIIRCYSYAADKQTGRQTDKQTDGLENPTHADRHSRLGWVLITELISRPRNKRTHVTTERATSVTAHD